MCVIFISNGKNSRPTLAQLESGEDTNRHGAGMSWVDGGKVKFIKGMKLTAKDIWDKMHTLDGPILIHFRMASSGCQAPELCHPFPLSTDRGQLDALEGTADSVIMHNGTIKEDIWQKLLLTTDLSKLPGGNWSDTRAVAYSVAHYDNQSLLSLFDDINKFAIQRPTGIVYWGYWTKHEEGLMTSCPLRTTYVYTKKYGNHETAYEKWQREKEEREKEEKEKKEATSHKHDGYDWEDTEHWNEKQWEAWGKHASDEEILALADIQGTMSSCYAG